MKKFGKVLLSSILCICLFVLLTSSVYAADLGVDEIAAKVQSAGVTDGNFAKAIAEALVKDGKTDSSLYEDNAAVKATLAEFNGSVEAAGRDIHSIEGISMLIGASRIVLDNNYITDITPIMSETPYQGYFYIQNNPVRVYLPSIQQKLFVYAIRTNTDSAIVTGQNFSADLNVVTDGSGLKAKIDFGASVGGKYYWNTLNGDETPPYVFYSDDESAYTFKYTNYGPESEDTNSCEILFNSPVSLTVRAYYEGHRYYSNWRGAADPDPQGHGTQMYKSPDFYYDVNVGFYTPVKQNTTTTVLGGVRFVKTDADGKPLAGATYALYMDDACTKMVGEGVTGSDGTLLFASLEKGTYYLKETSAPAGYKTDEKVYSVEVKAADVEVSTAFEGGYASVDNVVSSSEIELVPQWDNWDLDTSVHPLVLKNGSTSTVTASGDVLAFVKNKGKTITVLKNEVKSDDLSKLVYKNSDLTVKIGGETVNVKDYEEAKKVINDAINNGTLSANDTAIEIAGSLYYEVKTDYYDTVTVANESLCVFIAPSAYKKLVGRPIKEGEFGFELVGEDCAGPVDFVGYNLAAGANEDTTDVIFENTVEGGEAILRFCKVGEYNFVVKEIIPEEKEEGMRYDDKEYKVTVTVTESGDKGLKAVLAVDGKEVLTTYSTDTTTQDNEAKRGLETTSLCTIINTWTERENPKTGVPTLFSLVDLFTLAGLGVVLKKKFF